VTDGSAPFPPSWEQLVTGAHPSFRGLSAGSGGRGPARHGRDGWRADDDLLDPLDLGPCPENDGMGWTEAVSWTVVAGAVATVLACRLGDILH
jgi:hypothetical protein